MEEKQKKEERGRRTRDEKIKNEAEVWKYINKRRGRKESRDNKISREEWRNYFKKMLEGLEEGEEERNRETMRKEDEERKEEKEY